MAPRYEMCVGLDKGHKTTKHELKKRPASRKGMSTTRTRFIRDLVREVAGSHPMRDAPWSAQVRRKD
ncbi:60S ribosomal protein L36 [Caligus rogercresseyi]|uniref:Large ribosomal subunit protein eL36 n=1 Tax=Caligus rogercresseyi TaxID=217165 RepID=A0A7T8GZ14_CALRO|nr:60S ribosomal protein L36 [Caligus rogercresseyi]